MLRKTQALGSSNVKRDNLLETLAGVTRLIFIYIYRNVMHLHIYLLLFFFAYLQNIGVAF